MLITPPSTPLKELRYTKDESQSLFVLGLFSDMRESSRAKKDDTRNMSLRVSTFDAQHRLRIQLTRGRARIVPAPKFL